MSVSLDQEVYDEVFRVCQNRDVPVHAFLPDELADYPFIVVGEVMVIPAATKSRLLGTVTVTVDVWGDRYDRSQIAELMIGIMEDLSRIKRLRNGIKLRMDFSASTSRTLKDSTTERELWHGILMPTFRIS